MSESLTLVTSTHFTGLRFRPPRFLLRRSIPSLFLGVTSISTATLT